MRAQRLLTPEQQKSNLEHEIDMLHSVLRRCERPIDAQIMDDIENRIIEMERRYRVIVGNYYRQKAR